MRCVSRALVAAVATGMMAACGEAGLCMCSPHGTITVNQMWSETRPPEPIGGLWVRKPRRTSAAAKAGLDVGDRIIAIDEQAIKSDWDVTTLQKGILRHQSGEAIQLDVKRETGELEEIILNRP